MTEQTTPDLMDARNDQEQQQREFTDRASRIDAAWSSPEARTVHKVVQEDGNVDWRQFVGYCGGILAVVEMVDEHGQPDTHRIIPLVDEMFAKTAKRAAPGGMTLTYGPRNRPYPHQR